MGSPKGKSDSMKLLPDEEHGTEDVKNLRSGSFSFHADESNVGEKENNVSLSKAMRKRKRKPEDDLSLTVLAEVFLRILYPITKCMTKSIMIGLLKALNYSPTVVLRHGSKILLFSENAWESFLKHLPLIECYLTNNLHGRRTSIRLLDCDIEIDIIKQRGEQQVRFRDLTKHDDKILLLREEFYILSYATSPITRYMQQLVFSSSIIQDYLVDTMEKQPNVPILHGPIDTSIFNRIPHEVELWRRIKEYDLRMNTYKQQVQEEQTENEEHVNSDKQKVEEEQITSEEHVKEDVLE